MILINLLYFIKMDQKEGQDTFIDGYQYFSPSTIANAILAVNANGDNQDKILWINTMKREQEQDINHKHKNEVNESMKRNKVMFWIY